jgi:hypothetical protein
MPCSHRKRCITAFGTVGAGLLLSAARFDAREPPSAWRLARLYAPLVVCVEFLAVAVLSVYGIDRKLHDLNVATLARISGGQHESDRTRLAAAAEMGGLGPDAEVSAVAVVERM